MKIITVKKIREAENIKSTDHSKINFIWRSLDFLAKQDILDINGSIKPKRYIIKPREKIEIKKFLSRVKQKVEPWNT
ncbi:hypothetical protein LCGC14_1089720 [marine sediment metagenome]|uniref:Uncharacterized protein n=1 Tax=marine sediment metagenome TaxID=412755 RepID=A0A0F9QIQ3_9ZZZZ